VSGFDPSATRLVAESLSGTDGLVGDDVALDWGPEDIVAAWNTTAS
jgi:hypothetical protein